MAVKITKKDLYLLIDEVVLPFEKHVLNDEVFGRYMQDETKRANHNVAIAKLAIRLLYDNVDAAKKLFMKGSETHKELQITTEEMRKYLSIFFNLFNEWYQKHIKTDEFHKELMNKFSEIFAETYEYEGEDDFLMFESEEIDEVIETMHYKDEKKISAVEYASHEEILDDDLSSIIELKEEFEHILNMYEQLNNQYLEVLTKELSTLANIMFATLEFRDVGYGLNNFIVELKNLDIDSLDDTTKELAYALLSQMNEDIQKWIESLFITQDAVDIHYIDASFLANISQFSIMLEQDSSSEDESDDDFLF